MNSTYDANTKYTPESNEPGYIPLYRFWQPRYWLLWIGIGILRLAIMLPFRAQRFLGALLGRVLFVVAPKRRRIAEINLRICFPELDEPALRALVHAHGASLGFSVFEIGLALWADLTQIEKLVTLKGIDHVKTPLSKGQGVVILSGHFPALELVGRIVGENLPCVAAMYRPLKNPLVNQLLRRARAKSVAPLISKNGIRQMIRLLRKGTSVWYASDQSYHRDNAELVPFFSEPAMTNPSLTGIARMSKASVVPFYQYRLADGSGYEGVFLPALENFPSNDPAADAERVNTMIAEWARKVPEQYYWVHRRFKNRPEPWPDPYQDI
ncbi:MAG: lysophospholipid acyltransferase family protein [Gammaproteobacteria bacterium]|nr:lysophospholipid acyltransferase family protein [Gammaproteobacteria bacterium]